MRRPVLMLILACLVPACAPRATPVSIERVEDDATAAYLEQIQDAVRCRWLPPCKGVSEQGEVEAVDVSGNPLVGRYRAGSAMPGAVATVTWTWPAAVTRWERGRSNDLTVAGGELVHAYYPDRALLLAQNRPYSKNAGVDDPSGDRLFLCAP